MAIFWTSSSRRPAPPSWRAVVIVSAVGGFIGAVIAAGWLS